MIDEWATAKLEDVLNYIQPTRYIVSSTEYSDEYKTPVLTAGKSFIIGYTNEEDNIFDCLPTIIFDDFTTAIQFVNFKFKVKSSAMKILVPASGSIDIRYIFYLMKILRVNTDTHKRYWISNFSKLPIKLAPYHEQRVIADQIEELLSDLDNAIENIKKAKEQLEIYRLSILKEGFSGDLTKDWRKMYQDIKSGKEILVDITRQIKQPSLDLEDAAEIPEKWIYSSIVNLVAQEKNSLKRGPFGSSIKKSFFVPSGYKVYEQQNAIKNNCVLGRYYINKSKYEELEQFAVYPGDFIVSCAGTIGCIAEVPEGAEPGVINQALLKIKVNENILDKSFFLYQFKLYVEKFMRAKSRGSAMKNMSSVKELKQIPFVFTSIEEQRQIVSEIEARFSVCDKLEETIDNSLNQAESLRQSILKQAFEGKLTEQWRKEHKDLICGENSGESLLKKIKAEKEALEGKSRGRRKHD